MKKKFKYIIFIFMLFVLIRLVGVTYGFYEAIIFGNQNETSANILSKTLSILYTDGTAKMNFKGDYLFPGDSAEKEFTVTNTGDYETSYTIILDNVENTFERIQDLRYFIYINDSMVSEGAINNDEVQYLYYKQSLEVNGTDNIRFVFKYAETEESQNVDMNKTLNFRVNISANVQTSVSSNNNSTSVYLSNTTDTLNSYRIYGNSIQDGTPTVDSPVEIESVGDKSKNLFANNSTTTKSHQNGYTISTQADKSFVTIDGTSSKDYGGLLTTTKTLSAGTYTISVYDMNEYSKENDRIYISDENDSVLVNYITNTTSKTFTIDSEQQLKIYYSVVSGSSYDNRKIKIQIEEGSSATDYEEYGKYKIPITVSGKNMFDLKNANNDATTGTILEKDTDYIITKKNNYTTDRVPGSENRSSGWTGFKFNFYNGKQYTISYEIEFLEQISEFSFPVRHCLEEQGSIIAFCKTISELNKVYSFSNTFTAKVDFDNFHFTLNSSKVKISNIQIEEGSSTTDYETYIEPTTTYIYLDEPLRKVGDYADYIDLKEQRVVRNVTVNDNTGTKSISESYSGLSKPLITNISIPSLQLHNGTNIIKVDTNISPSKIDVNYYK